jgi:hypothetical protein
MSNICYNGPFSLEGGIHTKEQFLNIMDKNYHTWCHGYFKYFKCASCKKYTKESDKAKHGMVEPQNIKKPFIIPEEIKKRLHVLNKKCLTCRNNSKKCSLKQYMKYIKKNVYTKKLKIKPC